METQHFFEYILETNVDKIVPKIIKKNDLYSLEYLVDKEMLDPNGKLETKEGHTFPIILASMSGNLDIVKYFISKGCDLDVRDSERGNTPIMWAARSGCFEIVEYFLGLIQEHKMTVYTTISKRPYYLRSPFYKESGEHDILITDEVASSSGDFDKVRMLKLLEQHGFRTHFLQLYSAIEGKNLDVIKYLVEECGHDINEVSDKLLVYLYKIDLNEIPDIKDYLNKHRKSGCVVQ